MEQTIKKAASLAFNVKEEDVNVLYRLKGGMSNYTYVIDIQGESYTFRIPGKNAEKFVDRQVEQENEKRILPLGLNNETVYFDVVHGYRSARFLPGKILSENQPLDYLAPVAEALKKIHQSNIRAVNDYAPYTRLATYEGYCTDLGYVHPNHYHTLKAELLKLKETYGDLANVLCHGDAQPSNIVEVNGEIKILDWEFAGNNDPYYDIACYGNIHFEYALALLDEYLGRKASNEEKIRLTYHRFFQCMQWHNVAEYKHRIGLSEALHIPFDKIALGYLEKAENFLNSIRSLQ